MLSNASPLLGGHMDFAERVPAVRCATFDSEANAWLQSIWIQHGDAQLIISGRKILGHEQRVFEDCIAGQPLAEIDAGAQHDRAVGGAKAEGEDERLV